MLSFLFDLIACLFSWVLVQIGCTAKGIKISDLSLDALSLIDEAFDGVGDIYDMHTHLVGEGHGGTGCCTHPNVHSLFWHPFYTLQKIIFKNAAGIPHNSRNVDSDYLQKLVYYTKNFNELGKGVYRHFLLAMDHWYDDDGCVREDRTGIYVPNEYMLDVVKKYPEIFHPCVSIHPYREDCVDELEKYAKQGIRIVKWLPNSMGIDMSRNICLPFYKAMKENNMILLCHVGDEHSVSAGGVVQRYGNPLLLRYPLNAGVKVIAAHCASEGISTDYDSYIKKKESSFRLFLRLMDTPKYKDLLFADISSMILFKRIGEPLTTMLNRSDLHDRLVYGSDYPVPLIGLITRTRSMVKAGYINEVQRKSLNQIFDYNPLLFDFVIKRIIKSPDHGCKFSPKIFGWNEKLLGKKN